MYTCHVTTAEAVFDVLSHSKNRAAQEYFCGAYLANISGNATLSEFYHYAYEPYTGDKTDEVAGSDPSYFLTMTDCRKVREPHVH